jgi:Domain of unknown function (DUF4432)
MNDLAPGLGALTLANDCVEVTVLVGKGADIYSIVDLRTGVDVMFKSPWGARVPGAWPRHSSSMETWLEAYVGGWQLLLPNGGDECVEQGATWGYHGEAALLPWTVLDRSPTDTTLETRLFSAPLHVRRQISLDGPVVRVREVVTNESVHGVEVMWSHHPAFGAPFLEKDCVLSAGCRSVLADDRAPGTLLSPDSTHPWPFATSAAGTAVDLRRVPGPDEPRAVLAYLLDFESGYFAITNPRLRLGIGLRWPLEVFDKAWLWEEVHEGAGWPWFGRAYVVAVEPASTIPGQGMTNARAKGSSVFKLEQLGSRQVVIEAVLFEGTGAVSGIAQGGAVSFA